MNHTSAGRVVAQLCLRFVLCAVLRVTCTCDVLTRHSQINDLKDALYAC